MRESRHGTAAHFGGIDLGRRLGKAPGRQTGDGGDTECLQHAAATHVEVVVSSTPGMAQLEVRDDGTGFDAAIAADRVADGHVGLVVLRGLVSDAGGTMTIESRPGQGTTMRVEVPST